MPTCVFCNRAIQPDEPMTGRPPMAAHAACADAALADDRHWDAIAARSSDADGPDPAGGSPARSSRTGCLVLAFGVAACLAAVRARTR